MIIYESGSGNDSIFGYNANTTISIGGGISYSTTESGDNVIISAGNGSMVLFGAKGKTLNISPTIKPDIFTEGDDTYSNTTANTILSALGGNDIVRNGAEGVTIDGGAGNDSIQIYGSSEGSSINGGAGNDYLENSGVDSVEIEGGADNDKIWNGGRFTKINAGAGDDSIFNGGSSVTIDAGAGNDTIISSTGSTSIKSGAGNDVIIFNENANTGYATVSGGTGDDSISKLGKTNIIYQYSSGDGNDIISGYSLNDTISLSGNVIYTRETVANDVIISVIGSGAITLSDASSTEINIIGGTFTVVSDDKGKNITNTVPGILLNGSDYDDTINNDHADSVTINGGDGADSIKNTGSNVIINTGAGNDTIYNAFANNPTIDAGDGDDSIYCNNNYAQIFGGKGNDTFVGNNYSSNLSGGEGKDVFSITSGYWYNTIDGGADNDTIIFAGNGSSVNGGAGNDYISLSGGTLTVIGGTGNDIIHGDSTQSHIYQYKKGDGNDTIYGFGSSDMISIVGGKFKKSISGNNVEVSITGGSKIILADAASIGLDNINVNGDPDEELTPQDVIKKFMGSLDKSTITATGSMTSNDAAVLMLNEAINTISNAQYTTIQQVIDKLISDCRSYSNARRFLLEKCDIDLSNEDTGAITGSDASGGATQDKDAKSVVNETGSIDRSFTDNYFDVNGLRIYLSKYDSNNNPVVIDYYDSSLDNTKRYIWQGLHSWWAKSSLNLIAESYGDNFSYSSASSSTIEDNSIYFTFIYEKSGLNAYVSPWVWSGSGYSSKGEWVEKGDTAHQVMAVNMYLFDSIHIGDENGETDKTYVDAYRYYPSQYLDRTLAHEFTHAVMGANIRNHSGLPQFITDGAAETTHGIDDKRGSAIEILASDPDSLKRALNINYTANQDINAYSAGYIFMRYIAKQFSSRANQIGNASVEDLTIDTQTALVTGLSLSGNTLTASTQFTEEKINLADFDSKIVNVNASVLSSEVVILGNAANNLIRGGKSIDTIYGGAGADTVYGGEGSDVIFGGSGNDKLFGDSGDDTIYGGIGNDTVSLGAGADIYVYSGDNDVISDYKAGEDKIILEGVSITGASISSSDVVFTTTTGKLTIKNGKGKNITIIDADGNETTNTYPIDNGVTVKSGVMTIGTKFTDTAIDLSEYPSVKNVNATTLTKGIEIIGNAQNNSIKAGKSADTVYGGTGNDTVSLGGGADIYVYSSGNDLIQDYAAGQDKIKIESGTITASSISGSNIVLTVGDYGTLTIKSGKNKNITVIDSAGNETTQKYITESFTSSADLFEDDNFISGTARIDDISEVTSENYSVGKLETTNYEALAKDDKTFLAYTDKDK